MSFSGISFIFWRVMEIITLIPTMGMLAWWVNYFDSQNLRVPTEILVLFIVSTLAVAWTLGTLFLYSRAKHSASFVAFVDLLFVGAFIGAVYELRSMAHANCSHWNPRGFGANVGSFGFSFVIPFPATDKRCAMLKASWIFGIMNCIFFFFTFILALLVHRHHDHDRVVVKRETHHYHRGSRSHRSRSPRHSHHSRRSYV